jgi:biopolymer transport protein ExbB/TolQ
MKRNNPERRGKMSRKIPGVFPLLGVAVLLIAFVTPFSLPAQEVESSQEEVVSPPGLEEQDLVTTREVTISGESDRQTLRQTWFQFYAKGRPISDIIAIVLLLGLIIVIDEVRKISFDLLRSRRLRRMDLQSSNLDSISQEIERQPNSHLARTLSAILKSYHTTGNVTGIIQEINLLVQHLSDQFNSFRSRLDFLSDSAGALGLLGTVWGIFVTFEAENWSQDTVLRGMGLALVTTFIGIIVSLVLNLFSTEVFNFFNRRNELLQIKVKDFKGNLYEHNISNKVRSVGGGAQGSDSGSAREVKS